ncbi:adenomatous polyposis coli [Plakobranchus ocellatus]|uniref:Adenomatous polyposis coli n=1 Tax=Plakobranchus ocellatus TaxID=259542 RepID=A0AAV4CIR3_9GAST|nr:adenomatous polyposis coli [Plakobranchus ocellatus]
MSFYMFQAQRINLASPTLLDDDNTIDSKMMKSTEYNDNESGSSGDNDDEEEEEEEEEEDNDDDEKTSNSDDIENGHDDDVDDDEEEEDEDNELVSDSQSDDCSSTGDYVDDDDFDNHSLEIDEEERVRISAQLNSDKDSSDESGDEEGRKRKGGVGAKEEILEKEDSGQEKDLKSNGTTNADFPLLSHKSLYDDDGELMGDEGGKTLVPRHGQISPGTEEEGENSLTESAEGQRSSSDVEGRLQRLDSERSQLIKDVERDEQQRQWFYNQLSSITHKMEGLNMADSRTPEQERARRQLEKEASQVQGAMAESLGPASSCKMRQEARLARIRTLEVEIRSLQVQGTKQTSRDTKDASTLTNLSKEVSKAKLDWDSQGGGGYVLDRTVSRGGRLVSLSTQTGEIRPGDGGSSSGCVLDGVAPGMPFNPNLYHGAWPIEKGVSARQGPSSSSSDGAGGQQPTTGGDLASVISFNSTNTSSTTASNNNNTVNKNKGFGAAMMGGTALGNSSSGGEEQPQQLGTKVEMVYSLLSMLGTHDKDDMSRTLFAMSQSQDSCLAMRQSGCLPLLLQLLHGSDKDSGLLGKTRGSKSARARAAAALHNIVHCQHDDKRARREARTLRLLEQIRAHCDQQRQGEEGEEEDNEDTPDASSGSCRDMDHHPGAAIAALMKLSFDEDYRSAICTLGGLQAIAELLEINNRMVGEDSECSTTVRRYACMALTNLTFGDGKNKALLCSMRGAMGALVAQLASPSEDLIQAAASVLRNLSWRADLASKKTLREIGAVTTLMQAAMAVKKETTLKSILSALWNLSSHCSENKAEICAVDGALQFLVGLLTYKSQAKTLAIVENGGGILRNVSSQVAIREDYRQILRNNGCLQLLLQQLRSTSLTIVSNACGTLWNLSARCAQDQTALREMGAVAMLRNLVHSRHKMISSGSSAALRNLLASIPEGEGSSGSVTGSGASSSRPSLHARKQRALEEELASQNLAETCENVESPRNSPLTTATTTSLTNPPSNNTVEGGGIHRSESEPRRFVYHHMNNSNSSVGSEISSPAKSDDDGRRHMTRRQMMPRNGTDNAGIPGAPKRVVSPQCVARAGSQDSVGSTHSDISHDRRRAHSMLARSSQLLNKRQGHSMERKSSTGSGDASNSRAAVFPPGSADHKMMLLQQQQRQLQQQLLLQQQQQQQQLQHHHPTSSSSSSLSSSSALNGSFSPALVNNTPAHSSRRPHHQQQQHPHHQNYPQHFPSHPPSSTTATSNAPSLLQHQSGLTGLPPNSRIVQYMQEVAMYAGVEPSSTFQTSSLTQSAPTSQSMFSSQPPSSSMYSNTLPASLPSASSNVFYHHHHQQQQQQQQQQALLERLAAKSSSSNINQFSISNSLTSSGTALSSAPSGQLNLSLDPSVEDDQDDQPVNYSLKYQDVAISSGQASPRHYGGHIASSQVDAGGTFRLPPELLRAGGLSSSMAEQTSTSVLAGGSSSGSLIVNPVLVNSPLRQRGPVPNLAPNRFSTPQGKYRPGGMQFMTPQGPAYPGSYQYSQRFPGPALSSSFSSPYPSGYPSGAPIHARSFSLPSAHQGGNPILSRSAMTASLSAYAETDLDLDDQPTDFSLRYSEEVAEDLNPGSSGLRPDYQPSQDDQPINYSMRFHREESLVKNQEQIQQQQEQRQQQQEGSGAPNCVECRYAEARRTNEQLDNSSNDDQVRTFCTEGTPYLSTATSLTDLVQAGRPDDENEEEEDNEAEGKVGDHHHLQGRHVQGCQHRQGTAAAAAAQRNISSVGGGLSQMLNESTSGGSGAGNMTLVDPDRTLTSADAERSKAEVEFTASSSGSQTTDRHTGSTVVAAARAGSSLSSRADSQEAESQSAPQNFHADANEGASDQTKLYYEEGTPTCFSRVSSLSSLHSSEARENNDCLSTKSNSTGEKVELPCIKEADGADAMLVPALENKTAVGGLAPVPASSTSADVSTSAAGATGKAASSGPGSNLRRVAEQGQRSDREAKTVTFDENHQVEETPLMFSRSSSPESLSSFDTQSVHSSVVSEYSRRASQVVSPSEIPDSPSESMPSSPPRRAHSPTRRFREHLNNFSSTPKSTNVLAKQSLDMNRTPAALRPEPFMSFAAFDESNKPLDFTNSKLSGLPVPSSGGKIPPNPGLMLRNFQAFDDEEDDQPINFSSRDQESQLQPVLTFSTFQKNIAPPPPPPPLAHQQGGVYTGFSNGGGNSINPNRVLTPRGKSSLPTLVEQSVAENAETESSSGKSEVPVVYAEEGTPPNMSETTSLSGLTMDRPDLPQGENSTSNSLVKGMAGLSISSQASRGYLASTYQQPQYQTSSGSFTPGAQSSVLQQLGNQSLLLHHQYQQQQQGASLQQQQQQQGASLQQQQQPLQHEASSRQILPQEPNLPKLEEKEGRAESVTPLKISQPSQPSSQSIPNAEKEEKEEAKANAPAAAQPSGDQCSPSVKSVPADAESQKQEDRDSSMSEVSEGEEDILAQCISSGMPTPSASSARKMRRSSSDNNIKKRSGIPTKTDNTSASPGQSKSGAPSTSSSSKQTSSSSSKHPAMSSTSSKQRTSAEKSPKQPKPSLLPSASPQKSAKSKTDKPSGSVPVPGSRGQEKLGQTTPPSSSRTHQLPATSSVPSHSQGEKSHSKAAASATTKSSASKNLNPALNRAAAIKALDGHHRKAPQSPAKSSSSTHKPTGAATVISQHAAPVPSHADNSYADFSRDCVKSYATEGTPINFSAATSLSDLSILTHSSSSPSNKKSSSSSKSPGETDSKSDNSSLCEENEELLLSQMIEQGMPKGRSSGRRFGGGGDNSGGGSGNDGGKKYNSKDCNTSAFVPRTSNLTVVAPFHDFVPAQDTMKTYNVEGTPRNFSAATSLSDLTIDSIEGPVKLGKAAGSSTGQQRGGKSSNKRPPLPPGQPAQASYIPGPFSPPPSDSLHTYGVEGSPLTFSHNASSLSSLGDELEQRGVGSGVSASPHKDNSGNYSTDLQGGHGFMAGHTFGDRDESDSSSSIPRERHVVGQSSEDSSVAGDNSHTGNQGQGAEQPVRYTVEDTPVTFSRNSSLSSLNSLDKAEASTLDALSSRRPETGKHQHQLKRSDSVKSLGEDEDELADCDPTPSEQALLDQCINSAMPKSRLPRGDERARRHSRAKFLIQRGSRNASGSGNTAGAQLPSVAASTVIGGSSPDGLDKSGAAAGLTEGRLRTSGYHSSGEVDSMGDSGSQISLDGDTDNLMTRSCSDTTELCLDLYDTPGSARQSRYGTWKRQRQRHWSSDGAEDKGKKNSEHRSRSQDCQAEGSLKMHKNMSNKLARDSYGQAPQQGSLDTLHNQRDTRSASRGIVRRQQQQPDLTDFAAKVREISKDNMAGLVALKDDLDIDRAVFSGHGTLEVSAEKPVDEVEDEDISDVADVTIRSGRHDGAKDGGDEDASGDEMDQVEIDGDDDYIYEYVEGDDEEEGEDVNSESFNSELFEENVRLIVSEIQTTGKVTTNGKCLGSSLVDEDLFLENETISLVSNDAFSDTNSELSVDNSAPGQAHDGGSQAEVVGSTPAKTRPAGPRIVKPGEGGLKPPVTVKKNGEDLPSENKGIRGRRKPLYPGKSAAPAGGGKSVSGHTKAAAMVKPNMARGTATAAGSARPPLGSSASTTPPGPVGLKKSSPRSQTNQKVAHVSPTPRVNQNGKASTAAASKMPSGQSGVSGAPGLKARTTAAPLHRTVGGVPSSNTSVPAGSPPQMKNGVRVRAGMSPRGDSPATRSPPNQPSNKSNIKPGVKGTSLPKTPGLAPGSKARPSQSPAAYHGKDSSGVRGSSSKKGTGPDIALGSNQHKLSSPDNKENKEGQAPTVVVTMREKKSQSALSSSNRHSNCSQDNGSDGSNDHGSTGSNTSDPSSWGKALDSYNFYVDEAQDGQAYKQIQNQRNSRDAPESIKRSLKGPGIAVIPDQRLAPTGLGQPGVQTPTAKASRSSSENRGLSKTGIATRSASKTGIASRSPSAGRGTAIAKAAPKPGQQHQAPVGRGRGGIPTKIGSQDGKNHKSNDSLKSQGRPITPVGRRSSSNSSGSGIPTPRRNVSGGSPSSPAAAGPTSGRRPQTSKIAMLRGKRDRSVDESPPSSGSSTSSSMSPPLSSSRMPTKQQQQQQAQPSRGMLPSGSARPSTKKASTLPAGSSLEQAVAAGIGKSSTFEKLSTGRQISQEVTTASVFLPAVKKVGSGSAMSGLSRASGSSDSPETGVRRGEVFEVCDDNADDADYDDVYEENDDADTSNEAIPVFEDTRETGMVSGAEPALLVETPARIDSGTYRRKKPASDLELPNADETCRSMCSFNDSVCSPPFVSQPETRATSSGSSHSISDHTINFGMSTTIAATAEHSTAKPEEKSKSKSKVAQGLKKLFGSGRAKSKDSEKSGGKTGKKSSKWDRKHSKDLDFFSRNIKMEPSTLTDAGDDHLLHTSGIHLRTGGSGGDHKFSPSAIVTPFNYSPPSAATTNAGHETYTRTANGVLVVDLNSAVPLPNSASSLSDHSNQSDSPDGEVVASFDQPLTKTEILMARMNGNRSGGDKGSKRVAPSEDVNTSSSTAASSAACMITTV